MADSTTTHVTPQREEKKKRPMVASGFVLPIIVASCHAYFLLSQYAPICNEFNESKGLSVPWWRPVTLSACYVVAVFLGKKFMQKSDAMEPLEAMLVHNVYQTLLSLFMFAGLFWETFGKDRYGWNQPVVYEDGANLAYFLWVNYQSKFVEFFDTMFMIVRKSFGQVSTLHVSHHAEMGIIMWIVIVLVPGGVSYFGPMLNSLVHTVMYLYYALAALGYRASWKRFITQGQLVQFVLVMAHSVYSLVVAEGKYWPPIMCYISFGLMVQMLSMFGDFYKSTYSKAKPAAKKSDLAAKSDAAVADKEASEEKPVEKAVEAVEPPTSGSSQVRSRKARNQA